MIDHLEQLVAQLQAQNAELQALIDSMVLTPPGREPADVAAAP